MRVRATVKCFIDNTIREAEEVFEYNGPLAPHLVPEDEDEAPRPQPSRRRREEARASAE